MLVAAVLGSSLASVDATVVTIALPAIGADLGGSFAGLQWTVTGYTLTLAALILLAGAAGDRFGRRRVFLFGVVWFTVASVLCAVAPTMALLIAARVLQGIGAALLTPGSLSIIESVFRPEDRSAAVATWAGFSGVAGALAPFAGGWLLGIGTWRWVFLINVPLALVVIGLMVRYVPESRDEDSTARLDWAGAVATSVALGGLTYALIDVGRDGWSAATAIALAVTATAGCVLVAVERTTDAPILSPRILQIRQFQAANLVTFLAYGAIAVYFLMLTLQLQVVSGWSPLAAGLATTPTVILTLALSRASASLSDRVGPRVPMTVGPLVLAVATLLALSADADAAFVPDVLPSVTVFGLGLGVFVAPLTATAIGSVPAAHAGVASGVNNAVARTASLIAIAAVPVLAGLSGDAFSDPTQFESGFATSMLICSALFVLAALAAATATTGRSTTDADD
ncbi:DHA2 family efflux MFS transporter permease subunit [Nocardioides sp. YIM 152315]|nr:DHA2 family efflux MFS transporter permease subunit [Nocardioides sp. YIM 152315]